MSKENVYQPISEQVHTNVITKIWKFWDSLDSNTMHVWNVSSIDIKYKIDDKIETRIGSVIRRSIING